MMDKDFTNVFVSDMLYVIACKDVSLRASHTTIEDLIWDWVCYDAKADDLDKCKTVGDAVNLFLKDYKEWFK